MQRSPSNRMNSLIVEDFTTFEQGEDPRQTMARVNARIVAYQSKGLDVPGELLRLNMALAAECVAQSQAR
jgi:hypothetical protein